MVLAQTINIDIDLFFLTCCVWFTEHSRS